LNDKKNKKIKYKIQVSIVVKDSLQGLKRTLHSIKTKFKGNSTSTDFVIYILDGYSTDGSWEFVEAFKQENPQLNIFADRSKPMGVYNAMNICILNSNATWIWFINAGDMILASADAILAVINSQNYKCNAIVGGNSCFFSMKAKWSFYQKKSAQLRSHQSTIYKIELHYSYNLYDEKWIGKSDTIFLNKLKSSEVVYITDVISATLVSTSNISRRPKTLLHDFINQPIKEDIDFSKRISLFFKIGIYSLEQYLKFPISTFFRYCFFGLLFCVKPIKISDKSIELGDL